MTTVVAELKSARDSVAPELFDQLVNRVASDHGVDHDEAERIVDQALAFLHACALETDEALTPSRRVDLGWHAFILYTREYATFCRTFAGRFIHHVPDNSHTAPASPADRAAGRLRTLDAIERAGYAVDPGLWTFEDCAASCHDDEGCSGTGRDGNENRGSQIPR